MYGVIVSLVQTQASGEINIMVELAYMAMLLLQIVALLMFLRTPLTY